MRLQWWRDLAEGVRVNKSASVFGTGWRFLCVDVCLSDEGGIQHAGVLRAAGSGLKQLLDQGRLLLLQLGDALALLRHLLRAGEKDECRVSASVTCVL